MPSISTVFRAAIMIAVGVVGVKAWHLYGPTNEQVKSLSVKAIELTQGALENFQKPAATTDDPRGAAPGFGTAQDAAAAPPATALAQAPPLAPSTTPAPPALVPSPDRYGPAPDISSPTPVGGADPLAPFMSRLEQLGARDTRLTPWGSDGKLYRFSCRAALASSPAMSQHFESVAADPQLAVEQVAAKMDAWRLAERAGPGLATTVDHAADDRRY